MQWRREPLVYFLLFSLGVFALHRLLGARAGGETGKIPVTAVELERLKAAYQRTWQRAPSETELDRLIEDNVRTELLAREAVAMGLHRDDTIIRRHLKLRMESLAQDLGRAEPTECGASSLSRESRRQVPCGAALHLRADLSESGSAGASLDRDVAGLLATLNAPDRNPLPKPWATARFCSLRSPR